MAEKAEMSTQGSQGRGYARIGGGRQLHYRYASPETAGPKPALVCLHCSPMSGRVFEAFLPVMAQDRVVIAIDSPGYGGSDPLAEPASIQGYANAIFETIEALTLGTVDLLGYHTGSAVAVEMGLSQPDRVGKLAIISALMFEDKDRAGLEGFRKRDQTPVHERVAALPQTWTFWRNFWRDLPSDEIAWPLFLDSMLLAKGQYDGFFAAFGYDFPKAVAALKKPLAVFNPSDDLYEMTLRVQPLLGRDGVIVPLPGWTHGFLHAHAAQFAGLLRSYLDA